MTWVWKPCTRKSSSLRFRSHGSSKPREVESRESSSERIASPIYRKRIPHRLVDEWSESFRKYPRFVKTDGSRGGAQALIPRPLQPSQVAMGSRTIDPRICRSSMDRRIRGGSQPLISYINSHIGNSGIGVSKGKETLCCGFLRVVKSRYTKPRIGLA
jgi:hypothetical protein